MKNKNKKTARSKKTEKVGVVLLSEEEARERTRKKGCIKNIR